MYLLDFRDFELLTYEQDTLIKFVKISNPKTNHLIDIASANDFFIALNSLNIDIGLNINLPLQKSNINL